MDIIWSTAGILYKLVSGFYNNGKQLVITIQAVASH